MRLLLAEDETEMARIIAKGLRENSFAVDVAADGEQALYYADVNSYDLAILDVMLPLKDGFSVCRELRKRSFHSPVLMLTALGDPEDIICGLNCGADDYISKPFEFPVLLARIRALLRRAQEPASKLLQFEDLKLNTLDHTAVRAGRFMRLTAKEYALLELLMLHPGQVITRRKIAEQIWDEPFDPDSNVIDVYVNRLRKKIDHGFKEHLIQTRRSEGYVLSKALEQ
jgi:DNA-binding response OmpR family regulator